MKTLVLYVTTSDEKYRINVKKFIKDGCFLDENVDFFIIYNGKKGNDMIPEYVRVIERPNQGYDFGAWFDVIKNHVDRSKYDYVFFVNSSVYGPCLPKYIEKKKWISILTDMFSDTVKLVGCTMNHEIRVHINSYLWGVDREFLEYLIKDGYFDTKIANKNEAIMKCETMNTSIADKAGFKYRVLQPDTDIFGIQNVTLHPGYVIKTNPYDVLFMKTEQTKNNLPLHRLIESENRIDTIEIVDTTDKLDESIFKDYPNIVLIKQKPESYIDYIINNYLVTEFTNVKLHNQRVTNATLVKDLYKHIYMKNMFFPTYKKFITVHKETVLDQHGIPGVIYTDDNDKLLKDIDHVLQYYYHQSKSLLH